MNPLNDNQVSPILPGRNDFLNLEGFIQSREDVPTNPPRKLSEQIVLVSGGGSTRAYLYDIAARAWRFTTLS